MGRFFLPADTRGMWDRSGRSLTVFVGEDVFIGFEGIGGEARAASFSASQHGSGEYAREVYDDGPTRLLIKIDTPQPLRLTFTATGKDGRDAAPPIEILVKMRPSFADIAPVGQMDSNACWAACLQWWLKAAPNRTQIDQPNLLVRSHGMVGADGTIDPAKMTSFVSVNNFGMTGRSVAARSIRDFFGMWPLLIGFKAPGGFGHMNVLHGENVAQKTVRAMEPWAPDPDLLGDQLNVIDDGRGPPVYAYKTDGAPYRFLGAQVTRPATYYTDSPMNSGQFWVGVPSEYLARM
ncbi:hypothetical protein EYW49_05560 [Siculibacillus lacustris]|uniref:Uncharacterized protein n=1 Tax=Siculibacillus lacustris TaxID=1549641 RepID=A0A4Q9VUJ5_9HYPH|nr:hypothetical protein [Siculibacillus lacustris]TBW39726.1 hypothetical protein EYW49_05560 [Siculibacillus lacustris]